MCHVTDVTVMNIFFPNMVSFFKFSILLANFFKVAIFYELISLILLTYSVYSLYAILFKIEITLMVLR